MRCPGRPRPVNVTNPRFVHRVFFKMSICAASVRLALIVSAKFIYFITLVAHAETAGPQPKFIMALPGEACRFRLDDVKKGWTKTDEWAWKRICEGRTVNFNDRLDEEFNSTDPKHVNRWSDKDRMLNRHFLSARPRRRGSSGSKCSGQPAWNRRARQPSNGCLSRVPFLLP